MLIVFLANVLVLICVFYIIRCMLSSVKNCAGMDMLLWIWDWFFLVNINMVFSGPLSLIFNFATSASLSYDWSYGSSLGVFFSYQILCGIVLSICYSYSFGSIVCAGDNIFGYINLRWFHINLCSVLFILLWFHYFKSLVYDCQMKAGVFLVSFIILLLTMSSSFLGYVLPWSNISFWSATVISSLVGVFSIFVQFYVWGNFVVSSLLLSRFLISHVLLPFIILVMLYVHLLLLHGYHSFNVGNDVISFSAFLFNDLVFILFVIWSLDLFIALFFSSLCDADNQVPANPCLTPAHINPEWYFLFAYALLRCITDKLVGVICLFLGVVLLLLPSRCEYSVGPLLFVLSILTFLGGLPVSSWFTGHSQLCLVIFFLFCLFPVQCFESL